jgi:hypothetical protein
MRWCVLVVVLTAHSAAFASPAIRCDDLSTADLTIDGLLDDWTSHVLARAGAAPDAAIELRCSWDGDALGLALELTDDRVVRVRGKGHEDRVAITIAAGGAPLVVSAHPGTPIAKPRRSVPRGVAVADSLQPRGFSIEARIPAAALAGLSPSTPALELAIVFHDADRATGGDDSELALAATIELGDRKDLLDDFLRATRLRKAEIRLDTLADLDPDRRGKERVVAGGAVIGVLTDRFSFVTLAVARPADVKRVELLALGPRGLQVISAVITQTGNGGSRDLLGLWTVWGGRLEPLAQIEIRKQLGGNLLEAGWKLVKGRRGPELWVEPRPAVGWTAETWNELPATDADPIVVPWDAGKAGVAYTLTGAELARRDLPLPAPGRRPGRREPPRRR